MKQEFSFSDGDMSFVIKSHAGFYYLKNEKTDKTIAKSDDQKTLRAYIDGYAKGKEAGTIKYFDKYLEFKGKIKGVKSILESGDTSHIMINDILELVEQ